MEKIKEFFQRHKWMWGVVAGTGALIAYFLFRGGGTGSYPVADTSTGTGGGGMGTPSGGGGVSSDSSTLPAVAGLFSGFYDSFKNLLTANQESNLASQQALMEVLASSQEDTRSLIDKLADKINGLSAPVAAPATNEPPSIVKQILDPAAQQWTAPISAVVGGSGGGNIVANKETIDNWYSGGSKTSGSGSADFSGWTPSGAMPSSQVAAVTSSLEGKSSSEKAAGLAAAGLTRGGTGQGGK